MMKNIPILVLAILSMVGIGCNKEVDNSKLDIVYLVGTYKVVYEANESIDQDGNLVVSKNCNTNDIVMVSEDFFTWMVGDDRCPSKDYYENWPYAVTKNGIYLFSASNIVEYWDGKNLRLVSDTNPANGRYVLELTRN